MIIVDKLLKQRANENRPIRVGLVGAGYMGRGIALQIISATPGMTLAAVANRTLSEAESAYKAAGLDSIVKTNSPAILEDAISRNLPVVTDDAQLVCKAEEIDAIIEVTGAVEYSAKVVVDAIENRKHVVLMNAELDATVGPILKVKADAAGVIITNADGDQPGVIMNLYRYVKSIGCNPVLAGNMKGLQDPYRTPETQKGYAEQYGQKPRMVTSFADGTKISMEMAVVANATGFRVGQRGMYGPRCNHVNEAVSLFPMNQMLGGGLVDYVLGAEPAPGVFIIGHNEHPLQRQYLNYYKMGKGPLYVFYTPYHLCHLETPMTAARAVLLNDATVAPLSGAMCDVAAIAKTDLRAGDVLDGIGGFTCYGVLENAQPFKEQKLIPMGLIENCRMTKDVPKDKAISYDDVMLPKGRLVDRLRTEQSDYFNQQ